MSQEQKVEEKIEEPQVKIESDQSEYDDLFDDNDVSRNQKVDLQVLKK